MAEGNIVAMGLGGSWSRRKYSLMGNGLVAREWPAGRKLQCLMPSGLVKVLVQCDKGQRWATDLWFESGKADWYHPSSKMVELNWRKQEDSSGFAWWRERLNATLLLEGMVAFWTR